MIQDVSVPADADEEAVRDYSAHVKLCATCKHANVVGELCATGGVLWDTITDDDPTDPAGVAP